MTVIDFLSVEQLAHAMRLYERPHLRSQFHADVLNEVVRPNMAEINRRLGQENSPDFIAYAIEHCLNECLKECDQ